MPKKIPFLSSVPGYNLAAEFYDQKENYLHSFERGKLLPLLGDVTGKKILDVGAGTGRISIPLARAGAEVTALDVSEEMLGKLRMKNKELRIVIGDAESLPFPNDYFDIVVAAFLIVHLQDPARFFDEAYRTLKDNGLLLVTNINQRKPPEVKTKTGPIVIESYYHRPEHVRLMLESLAFTIEQEIFVWEGEGWINQIILAKK